MPAVLLVTPCSDNPPVATETIEEPLPLRIRPAVSLMRLLFGPAPNARVPPPLIVMLEVPPRPCWLTMRFPSLIVVVPVKVLLPSNSTKPDPVFVIPPPPKMALAKTTPPARAYKVTSPFRVIDPANVIGVVGSALSEPNNKIPPLPDATVTGFGIVKPLPPNRTRLADPPLGLPRMI